MVAHRLLGGGRGPQVEALLEGGGAGGRARGSGLELGRVEEADLTGGGRPRPLRGSVGGGVTEALGGGSKGALPGALGGRGGGGGRGHQRDTDPTNYFIDCIRKSAYELLGIPPTGLQASPML